MRRAETARSLAQLHETLAHVLSNQASLARSMRTLEAKLDGVQRGMSHLQKAQSPMAFRALSNVHAL